MKSADDKQKQNELLKNRRQLVDTSKDSLKHVDRHTWMRIRKKRNIRLG